MNMTIQKVFRWVSVIFFLFIAVLIGLVILLYTNQRQIEDNEFLRKLNNNDLQQASGYIQGVAIMVICLLALIIFLYQAAYRRIARPVGALREQTRMVKSDLNRLTDQIIDISMGNFTEKFVVQAKPLELRQSGEFNELALDHNQMISKLNETGDAISTITGAMAATRDKLHDVNQWLERTVQERTRDLKAANEDLEQAHQELSHLDQAKSEFLRLISHEIRTPLNGIMGFTYLMKDLPQAPEVAEIFDILDVSVKRLEQFSKVALMITTLKTRNLDIHFALLKPADLIDPAWASFHASVDEKRLRLTTEGEMEKSIISGDPELLKVCMSNILENAVHYSPVGGTIFFRAFSDEKKVQVEVIDQGKGFTQEALKNLFKPFSPGEQHIDQNIGLDLTLVKMIMDVHNARIEAGNQKEGGAFVRLIFNATE
ncbi:MAG: ATP-binding protein [Bacteroidales bacterium]|nr:ATP-binding protein [Bacteroidales bacterium]